MIIRVVSPVNLSQNLSTNAQHQHGDDFGMGARLKGATRIGCCMPNGVSMIQIIISVHCAVP